MVILKKKKEEKSSSFSYSREPFTLYISSIGVLRYPLISEISENIMSVPLFPQIQSKLHYFVETLLINSQRREKGDEFTKALSIQENSRGWFSYIYKYVTHAFVYVSQNLEFWLCLRWFIMKHILQRSQFCWFQNVAELHRTLVCTMKTLEQHRS